jgi:hypothetical protein
VAGPFKKSVYNKSKKIEKRDSNKREISIQF